MPIVVNRNTKEVVCAQKLTPEQNQKAWEMIVASYAKRHPEIFIEVGSDTEKCKNEKEENNYGTYQCRDAG